MGGRTPDHAWEVLELVGQLERDRLGALLGEDLVARTPASVAVDPLAEIDVEPDTERAAACVGRRPGRIWPPHHQRGAGDDPLLVASDDAGIDPGRPPEVVRVDDQDPLAHPSPSSVVSSSASPSQSWACSDGG